MKYIEKYISPLIKNQFPDFYNEEGPMFIAFVKAYYEWLENNFQEIAVEDDTGFEIGDIIEQGASRGKIVTKYGIYFLVEIFTDEPFKCNTLCNDLTLARSTSGGVSFISIQRKYNVEYLARRLPEYRDVDKTIDNFIVDFKNKYLPDIQFTTASNKQLFIKNSLDFYRAKGTERAVDLFFKLIYGFEAKVYYPGDDIFKPSDNEWVNVEYLEIEEAPENVQFVGQIIVGAKTAASAYVERLVRMRKGARYISIIYLSNVSGSFQTDETVYTIHLSTNVTTRILGSLTSLEIVSTDSGFILGETLTAVDGAGKSAKARVSGVEDKVGVVNFELLQGGWGYSNNAIVLGSDRVLRLNNITIENLDLLNLNDPFYQFETIKQDLVYFEVDTLLPLNSTVTGYDVLDAITFNGIVVNSNDTTSSIVVNYNAATTDTALLLTTIELYTSGNVMSTSILSTNNNVSATANTIAFSDTATFKYTGVSTITAGDTLYQLNDENQIFANAEVQFSYTDSLTNDRFVDVIRDTGVFRTNKPLISLNDGSVYNITQMSNTLVGVIDIVNTFYNNANTYSETSGTYSDTTGLSYETKASFDIFSYNNTAEYIDLYSADRISEVPGVTLIDDEAYGLSGDPSLGYSSIISDASVFTNVELGSIEAIITRNPGNGYPTDPFYVVYDPASYHLERYDYIMQYVESDKNFLIGETIIGQTSAARGIITHHSINNKSLRATRINLAADLTTADDFIINEIIQGEDSGFSATLERVVENRRKPRTGLNASVLSEAQSGGGYASIIQIIDSGFGYYDEEFLTLVSINDENKRITAKAYLGKQGIGTGYHTNNKSFLSSNKYLHDNDFYQEYSYQVLTSMPFEIYKKTLIDVLHVAGTKPFGSYSSSTESAIEFDVDSEISIT